MAIINISNIQVKEENFIGAGKEVNVYKDGENVIKIFKDDRTSPFKKISKEGLIKLSELNLNHFNTPKDIIVDNENVIGYTEKFLDINTQNEENKITLEILDSLKEDLDTLSNNGFKIEDIFYNYTLSPTLIFFDLTSFTYTNTTKEELINFYSKKNIMTMNTFLVGLTMFDAYKLGSKYELTKTFKINEYINQNLGDEYFGDYLKSKKLKLIN
jgi:hypothetical protein